MIAQKGFGGSFRAQRVTTDLNAMNTSEQVCVCVTTELDLVNTVEQMCAHICGHVSLCTVCALSETRLT